MSEYKSDPKIISASKENVYLVLSDLQKLDLIKDKIPQDKVKDFTYDKDSCSLNISPIGNVKFRVTERQPNKLIKFTAEQLPFDVNLLINISDTEDTDPQKSVLELVVDANLNPFLKPMVSKPLQDGLVKISEMLSSLPFNDILNK